MHDAAAAVATPNPLTPARCTTQRVTAVGWPSNPAGPVSLTVHVTHLGLRQAATVGWASADGQHIGMLDPVHGAPVPTYQGNVPAERLQLYVDGLRDSDDRAAHARVDLRRQTSLELTVAARELRPLVLRHVVVRDRNGKPIIGVNGLPVSDGSLAALHNAVANFQQWRSDELGGLQVRSIAGEAVKLALYVPLLADPIEVTIEPDQHEVRLESVTSVRCSFRCPSTGQLSPYAGYVALAEFPDGTCNRFEMEESDAIGRGDISLAWPENARKLSVSSTPYLHTTLSAPEQTCELRPRPNLKCAFWD